MHSRTVVGVSVVNHCVDILIWRKHNSCSRPERMYASLRSSTLKKHPRFGPNVCKSLACRSVAKSVDVVKPLAQPDLTAVGSLSTSAVAEQKCTPRVEAMLALRPACALETERARLSLSEACAACTSALRHRSSFDRPRSPPSTQENARIVRRRRMSSRACSGQQPSVSARDWL